MNWYGIWALKTLGLAWDIKRVKLAEVERGLVPTPNGRLITRGDAGSFGGGGLAASHRFR